MNTFNAQPRPRVLFEDVPEADIDELGRLVPSFKVIQAKDEVHETEYDILVTFAEDVGKRGKHLHVLSFGATVGMLTGRYMFERNKETLANEVTITSVANPSIAALLETTVIPHIPVGRKYTWRMQYVDGHRWLDTTTDNLRGQCAPLLHVGKEKFVYAYASRRDDGGGGLQLALPDITQKPAEWLRLFLDLVADIDPTSVPPETEWKTSERWSPPEVGGFIRDIQTVKAEREKALSEFQTKEQALGDGLKLAVQRAETGPGRLLTADGDELTAAVLEALKDLGFSARDMDDHHDEKTGAKLEDLRVADLSKPDWHCLAEVKGYTKGAKVNDVSQITGRPVAAYTKETGDYPSSVWHIVNTWRGKPPSNRPVAVPNNDDLRPLTDAAGALLDTRDLFEAWRDVQAGKIEAEAVRTSMRSALTRWTYDPSLLPN